MNCIASAAAVLGALAIAGCASHPAGADEAGGKIAAPAVPAALRPPADQEPFARFAAAGVQIYECVRKPDSADQFAWQFRAPEATLTDTTGHTALHHGAGPSWTAPDGSSVIGQAAASTPPPQPGSIPWLLLSIKSRQGTGLLAQTASVQRIDTGGGIAPETPCGADNAGQMQRVNYTATYVFWRTCTSY
jgi:hypothetical protein